MRIDALQLHNFRNYDELNISFQPGVNVLYGLNGQGKTNLLEAIYLCTAARSHRTSKDTDLIRHDSEGYKVKLTFAPPQDSDYRESLEIRYRSGRKGRGLGKKNERLILHDGMELPRIVDLMGIFHAVMFAPEDLQLIKEGPRERRRFLDILISQLRPVYFVELQRLQTTLQQRNALLRHIQSHPYQSFSKEQLEIWNAHLAETSAKIINVRYEFCKQISNVANEFHTLISDQKEDLTVRYRTRAGLEPEMDVSAIETILLDDLNETMNEDIMRGYTTIGPQRDDMVFRLDTKDLRNFGSQGQQRTAVLSLKLSELRIIEEITGEKPILLLDDVMSELDQFRRKALVETITDSQIFITCTDAAQVAEDLHQERRQQISFYEVDNGVVRSESE